MKQAVAYWLQTFKKTLHKNISIHIQTHLVATIVLLCYGCVPSTNVATPTQNVNLTQTVQKTFETTNDQSATQPTHVSANRILAQVTEVVDGDTFKAIINDKEETVRMLLIDTPETKHPNKPVQPFGKEASEFTRKLIANKTVELEKDVSERDKYGRVLAYVYVDGKSVQEQLLEKGLARVAIYPPDVKYVEQYRAIQAKAQQLGIGIWSIENYVQKDGYHPEVAQNTLSEPSSEQQTANNTLQISLEEYAAKKDIFFANCNEARAAGVAPIHKGEPGYSLKLDRDGDGIACE